MKTPIFLTLAEVVDIHKNQIELYGGQHGIRDISLLESAIAQPEASFSGEWLHQDIFEMAAAYAFHICMNHPFFDGNKRAALASCLVFLEINRVSILDPDQILLNAVLKMADSQLSKKQFAEVLKNLPVEK
ncbi:MAG: type II toxin-antitoxin system death-on-curing family toxin [Candidatus Vogelbacteria bacterium]|nr:type II toxin-antitoxin system death-on-curing family toxin [Candidatus Vogelbacteria bacterium]